MIIWLIMANLERNLARTFIFDSSTFKNWYIFDAYLKAPFSFIKYFKRELMRYSLVQDVVSYNRLRGTRGFTIESKK